MPSPPEHYFTATPAGAVGHRMVPVDLAGRSFTVRTASGVFCPDRIDLGTAVLLREAPDPARAGALLDLGCGWGPIALTLGLLSPEADVWAVDVNERALDLVRTNAKTVGLHRFRAALPDDVPGGLRFATIWSNPPIRIGKAVLHSVLQRWLPRLEPSGAAYLVVAKDLGADSLARWVDDSLDGMTCARVATSKGFRVLKVRWAP
ncbi:MAG TPA: methyltransferase [Candidatus Lustribacter sp.]|nr:methyltransferase [Candidatus Lustribacter sp.]